MSTAMLKPKTAEPEVPDFAIAQTRWTEVRDKDREMIEHREGIKLALTFAKGGVGRQTPQNLRDQAEPFLALAKRRPRQLADQLDDLIDEIEDFAPKLGVEHELYQAARWRETNRLAGELQPRHRAAVKGMAKALEALSLAMTDEIEIRAELARKAPERESAKLPDCSSGLLVGTLADWNSAASEWARTVRKLKILE